MNLTAQAWVDGRRPSRSRRPPQVPLRIAMQTSQVAPWWLVVPRTGTLKVLPKLGSIRAKNSIIHCVRASLPVAYIRPTSDFVHTLAQTVQAPGESECVS